MLRGYFLEVGNEPRLRYDTILNMPMLIGLLRWTHIPNLKLVASAVQTELTLKGFQVHKYIIRFKNSHYNNFYKFAYLFSKFILFVLMTHDFLINNNIWAPMTFFFASTFFSFILK